VGSVPVGIALGDFRGDGRTDLAVADFGSSDVMVLLNNGDGTFQVQPAFAVGAAPAAIVTGDFNGDGRPDLAVADPGTNDVSVFLGNGDGTFAPPVTYEAGDDPVALVAGDFNGDGTTDLAVADRNANAVSVLRGRGDGTFLPPIAYVVGSAPVALVAGDFTGDGRSDIAVADFGSNDVSVLLSHGDGTFQPRLTFATPAGPDALVAGDFNGDGTTDLAVADETFSAVSIFLGQGNGQFTLSRSYAVGAYPDALVAGDFNGDGRLDLAVANRGSNNVSILLGRGDGTFRRTASFAAEAAPVALVAGDFGGDGRLDLAVVGSGQVAGQLTVLLNQGDGTFGVPVAYAVGTAPDGLIVGDFNEDGRPDLAVANAGSNNVTLLLGIGAGAFQTQGSTTVGSSPFTLVAGDFNGDGRTDLAVTNAASNSVSILLGNGDGTFQAQTTYAVGIGPDAIVTGDFNGDGRLDLAIANQLSDDLSVLLGNGDGTFQAAVSYPVESGPYALVAGDFNGDGRLDLAVADQGSDDVSVLLGNGDGTFEARTIYTVGRTPEALVLADFNGDGRLDLATANVYAGTVSVLLNNGDGTFSPQVSYSAGTDPVALAAGDFNGDGTTDLVVTNAVTRQGSVLLGNGDGTFQPRRVFTLGFDPQAIVTGDFNGDGKTDLAIVYSHSNEVQVLLSNGDGTFTNSATYAVGSEPEALAVGDFNGDRRADLATANLGSNDVSVLLNLSGTFVAPGSLVTTPRSNPVLADLTGDGVDDVVVVDGAGNILWRRGSLEQPGMFEPPLTINPGNPSRDIAFVPTSDGPMLASVDATDNAVALYAWQDGLFARVGSLATGLFPVQVVAADLDGDGWNDLLVRNAGDGTLSIFYNTASESGPGIAPAPFVAGPRLAIGPGASDVTTADLEGDGQADIVVANALTGTVGILRNQGFLAYAPLAPYRAGGGLYQVTPSGSAAAVTTREATAGVAAGALSAGGPFDVLAINPGANTLGVLSSLGGGRLSAPAVLPTACPATTLVLADLEDDGILDTIVLGAGGVSVYRGDGRGGLLPDPFTIATGPDSTGLSAADINHDGKPDLLVDDAYGDVLVLLGNGDGTFRPYGNTDQNVALAVLPSGAPSPEFIYADQGLDRVVVQDASGQTSVLGDRSSGLLEPDAVVLADLNGDGFPDLIVANSGSNNVLVYPGLGNGQFGPALNDGHGFFTGTNPAGITVANLNGRPDLVIANKSSNDVSILLNEPTATGGFMFVQGPRLQAGYGPTSTVVRDVNGDAIPDLLVTDSGSNQVRLLPGVGNGFFNDQDPKNYSVGSAPAQVLVGNFTAGPGPQIATINPGSNDVTLISDINSNAPVIQSFSTGGIDPVAAFGVDITGDGIESLVVANSGDGLFTLLGGEGEGLAVTATLSAGQTDLPAPSSVVLAGVEGDALAFYATTESVEAAALLAFILGTPPSVPSPVAAPVGAISASLLSFTEAAPPLISTLLMVTIAPALAPARDLPEPSSSASESFVVLAIVPAGTSASATSFTGAESASAPAAGPSSTAGPGAGQSLLTQGDRSDTTGESEPPGDEGRMAERAQRDSPAAPKAKAPDWLRIFLGIDEGFERVRDAIRARDSGGDGPDAPAPSAPDAGVDGVTMPVDLDPVIARAVDEVLDSPVEPQADASVSLGFIAASATMAVLRNTTRSHALRGNAVFDALRRLTCLRGKWTRSVPEGIPTRSVGTSVMRVKR
jgi:hypothetical protein